MRNIELARDEYYHIYNRGVDKRSIFLNERDYGRFINGLNGFNTQEIVGNLGRKLDSTEKLVEIIAYSLSQNHFHLLLTPVIENGIERFMHKLTMGYSKYFNTRYKRAGSLFQGNFKAIHVNSNEYLLHLSSYINLNNRVHKHPNPGRSSLNEYLEGMGENLCNTDIILNQFRTRNEYRKFINNSLKEIIKRKELIRELEGEMLTPSVNKVSK